MSEVTYQVDAATLQPGACPTTYQELADLFASIYSVTVNTNNTGVVVSSTKPADTTVVWQQIDSSGNPVRIYIFVGGRWLSLHSLEPGSIMLWGAALPNFATFDGGDANAPSVYSGPMWEEVTELRAKFPIGAGTLPSGTVLAVGDSGGEEKHTLTVAELPAHTHPITARPTNDVSNGSGTIPGRNDNLGGITYDNTTFDTYGLSIANTGGGIPSPIMPPYYTVYFLRRTSRRYFTVP